MGSYRLERGRLRPTSLDMATKQQIIPFVVRFWSEDGVWNAAAQDLPVGVFADTIEAAREALRAAIDEHFQLAKELGIAGELVEHLRVAATAKHAVEDSEEGEFLTQMFTPHLVESDCHPA